MLINMIDRCFSIKIWESCKKETLISTESQRIRPYVVYYYK